MKALRIVLLALVLTVLATAVVSADAVGFGITATGEFPEVPDEDEIYSSLFGDGVIEPGFLFYFRDDDWGMSFDFGFDYFTDDPVADEFSQWFMDFDFTMSYDWHILRGFLVDPILQIGFGMNMQTEITDEDYEYYAYEDPEPEYIRLGFHPVIGAGVDVNFGRLFVRGVMQYQGIPFAVPSPDVEPYDIAPVRVLIGGGILLR